MSPMKLTIIGPFDRDARDFICPNGCVNGATRYCANGYVNNATSYCTNDYVTNATSYFTNGYLNYETPLYQPPCTSRSAPAALHQPPCTAGRHAHEVNL